MTDLQKIRAGALKGIRRASVGHEDSFVSHMNHLVNHDPHKWLSAKQAGYLEKLCWKYREQLKSAGFGHVVPAQSPFDHDNHYTTDNHEHPTDH